MSADGSEPVGERLRAVEKEVEGLKKAQEEGVARDISLDRRVQATERFQASLMVGMTVIIGFLVVARDAIVRAIVKSWPV